MQCVICAGTSFSIRASDFQKSRQEQIKNSKYGDCCCLSCALKKSQKLIAYHGYDEKKVLDISGNEYTLKIPMSYKYNCVICDNYFIGFGHDPQPVKNSGGACEYCNTMTIIPARQAAKLKILAQNKVEV